MYCSKCGTKTIENAKFCAKCDRSAIMFCLNCGNNISEGSKV